MILNDLHKAAMGTVPVKKIYLGDVLIFPKGSPVPPDNEIWYETSDGIAINTANNFAPEPGTTSEAAHVIESSYGRIVCDKPIAWIQLRQFTNCDRITSILFPDSVKGFYEEVLYGNTRELTRVYIPASVYDIGGGNFNAPLTELSIPSIEIVRQDCFNDLNVGTLTIPDSVKTIMHNCFNNCQNKTLIMSKNVQTIEDYCFRQMNIGTLDLPASLRAIGDYSFTRCYNLGTINFEGTMAQWDEVEKGERVFDRAMTSVVHCSDGDVEI